MASVRLQGRTLQVHTTCHSVRAGWYETVDLDYRSRLVSRSIW